jgi:hypothetical protein
MLVDVHTGHAETIAIKLIDLIQKGERASLGIPGGVPERLNGAVSKTVRGLRVPRGFESHPLRLDDR